MIRNFYSIVVIFLLAAIHGHCFGYEVEKSEDKLSNNSRIKYHVKENGKTISLSSYTTKKDGTPGQETHLITFGKAQVVIMKGSTITTHGLDGKDVAISWDKSGNISTVGVMANGKVEAAYKRDGMAYVPVPKDEVDAINEWGAQLPRVEDWIGLEEEKDDN